MLEDLSHIDARGHAQMVNVGHKPPMKRTAIAEGFLSASVSTIDRLMEGDLPKGEALSVARIAGILAAKRCAEFIPLCHTLPLEVVSITFERTAPNLLKVEATAQTTAKTGVEMEALLATSTALLTIWDMVKAIDTDLAIEHVRLVLKRKEPC